MIPENRAILIGFNHTDIDNILRFEDVKKIVIFDANYGNKAREEFTKLYKLYKNDKITLYEGDWLPNLTAYLDLRRKEGSNIQHTLYYDGVWLPCIPHVHNIYYE
jgi:hypothetical protein